VYFIGVLRQKWVENSFLDEKNINPVFLATTVAEIQGSCHCIVYFYLKEIEVNDMSSIPLFKKKKN
jgi:ferredoxin-thioredoxin reductase catalytic subunit